MIKNNTNWINDSKWSNIIPLAIGICVIILGVFWLVVAISNAEEKTKFIDPKMNYIQQRYLHYKNKTQKRFGAITEVKQETAAMLVIAEQIKALNSNIEEFNRLNYKPD